MQNTVRRTTLIVRDIAVSTRWYEQVVGMMPYYDSDYVINAEGFAGGKEGDLTHLTILKCQDPEIGMIGLVQFLDPPRPAPAEIPTRATYGNPTFVVATDDAWEVCRRAKEFGTPIESEPHEWSVEGPTGEMLHFLGMSIFDPDGHYFQFNQLLESGPKA